MAQIVINIVQGAELGAIMTPMGMAIPIGTSIEVNGNEDEVMALLVAHKLAETYHTTLDNGVKAAVKSIMEEANKK